MGFHGGRRSRAFAREEECLMRLVAGAACVAGGAAGDVVAGVQLDLAAASDGFADHLSSSLNARLYRRAGETEPTCDFGLGHFFELGEPKCGPVGLVKLVDEHRQDRGERDEERVVVERRVLLRGRRASGECPLADISPASGVDHRVAERAVHPRSGCANLRVAGRVEQALERVVNKILGVRLREAARPREAQKLRASLRQRGRG